MLGLGLFCEYYIQNFISKMRFMNEMLKIISQTNFKSSFYCYVWQDTLSVPRRTVIVWEEEVCTCITVCSLKVQEVEFRSLRRQNLNSVEIQIVINHNFVILKQKGKLYLLFKHSNTNWAFQIRQYQVKQNKTI